MKKLSIIIPVFNEERTILEILKRVFNSTLIPGYSKEIILVDDGSTDETLSKVKDVRKRYSLKVIKHSVNQGKGEAIKTGLSKATGDVLLIQDADLEYNPKDYKKLLRPIMDGKAWVVYGSRLKDYPLKLWGKDRTPLPSHWFGNKFLTMITNMIYNSKITDMETCYKIFKRDILKNIKLKSKRFNIEPEITAKILKKGYPIFEVPIKVKPRGKDEGKKITWRDGFSALYTLVKYRFTN